MRKLRGIWPHDGHVDPYEGLGDGGTGCLNGDGGSDGIWPDGGKVGDGGTKI